MENKIKKCLWCAKEMEGARSNKKYCSDNCKIAAFYSRSSSAPEALNVNHEVQDEVCEEIMFPIPNMEQHSSSFCTPQAFNGMAVTLNDTVKERKQEVVAEIVLPPSGHSEATQNTRKDILQQPDEPPYNWIESDLICQVAEQADSGNEMWMMLNPEKHFDAWKMAEVKTVTVWLRSLIEHLLRLGEQPKPKVKSLKKVHAAFKKLTSSFTFRFLPSSYPYTAFATTWEQKIKKLLDEDKDQTTLVIMPFKTKVELIVKRYQMAALVEALPLSELQDIK